MSKFYNRAWTISKGGEPMPNTFEELNKELAATQTEMASLLSSTFTPQQLANVYVLGDIHKVLNDAYIIAQAERQA